MAGFFRNAPRDVGSFVLIVAAVGFGSGFAGGQAVAAAGGPFLAHQALYELSLVKSRGSNSINDARGRILYNFSGGEEKGLSPIYETLLRKRLLFKVTQAFRS